MGSRAQQTTFSQLSLHNKTLNPSSALTWCCSTCCSLGFGKWRNMLLQRYKVITSNYGGIQYMSNLRRISASPLQVIPSLQKWACEAMKLVHAWVRLGLVWFYYSVYNLLWSWSCVGGRPGTLRTLLNLDGFWVVSSVSFAVATLSFTHKLPSCCQLQRDGRCFVEPVVMKTKWWRRKRNRSYIGRRRFWPPATAEGVDGAEKEKTACPDRATDDKTQPWHIECSWRVPTCSMEEVQAWLQRLQRNRAGSLGNTRRGLLQPRKAHS